ncbi:Uncharacterised protein [Bordetella pertussis]|nr:Uncharacterised protein [Bordetella pertussis]CFP59288.1 Uncharacterised protein [Bordetella pertussis]CFW36024.1 Uncharacterised protein [Bordetella pertussis]
MASGSSVSCAWPVRPASRRGLPPSTRADRLTSNGWL